MFWHKHTGMGTCVCFFKNKFTRSLASCFVCVFSKPHNDVKSSLLQSCLSSNYIHLNEFKLSFYTWFPSSVELPAFLKEKYIYFLLISFAAHRWTKLRKSQETIIHKHSPVNLKRFHAIDALKRIGFFNTTLWKFRTDLIGSSFRDLLRSCYLVISVCCCKWTNCNVVVTVDHELLNKILRTDYSNKAIWNSHGKDTCNREYVL